MNKVKVNLDVLLHLVAVGYLTLPIILFCFGWLDTVFAVLCFFVLAGATFAYLSKVEWMVEDLITGHYRFWAIVIAIVLAWCLLSGIGGYGYQNDDFYVRNPIYRDLVNKEWPVFFDLSQQRGDVRELVGSDNVAFVYYFTFWLIPAGLTKIFGVGGNQFLLLWTCIGILLVIYFLNRYFHKNTFIVPTVLIFFSGMDIIGYIIGGNPLGFTKHLEWWARFFQYSSNTTLLFWVFNQAVPAWLVTALLINSLSNKYIFSISSLLFAY